MSKKQQRDVGDAFGGFLNETAADSSNAALGVPAEDFDAGVNSDKLRYIDIFKIEPDPMQPRRAIPNEIRADWTLTSAVMSEFLQHWSQTTGIDLRERLESTSDGDRPEPNNPSEAALLTLIDLAASIRRDGLQNAISVIATEPGRYGIETGERRWLAHHLLHSVYGEEKYRLITVKQVNERNVWRQASENNARENLNAIARARQLAILLMDLHGMINFQPLENFEYEQDFYAQVADSKKWRVPDGTVGQLLVAMGFRQSDQLRKYRMLLRLPREAWQIADDENIPERPLRDMQSTAGDNQEMLVDLIKNYRVSPDTRGVEEDRVSTDTVSIAIAVTGVTPSRRGWSDQFAKHSLRSRSFWEKATQNTDKMSPAARLQLRTIVEEERALLDALIARLEAAENKK